jgi:nitrate/nitrite-specific signal transduction histidine kinase
MDDSKLIKSMGALFSASLKITSPVSQLFLIREKIAARGFHRFDKNDILDELGRLQHITTELHKEMLNIYDLIKLETSS